MGFEIVLVSVFVALVIGVGVGKLLFWVTIKGWLEL